MKKLILLAVVVFGFAATSLGQPVKVITGGVITGGITPAGSVNADANIATGDVLSFGSIVSSTQYDGSLLVKANGQIVKTNVTASGNIWPATFNVTKLMSGTPIITLGTKHWDWGTVQLDINPDDPDNLYSSALATPGSFTVRIGGLLTIAKNSTQAISINNFTVTLNNQ